MRLMFISLICLLIGCISLKAKDKCSMHSTYFAANEDNFEIELQHEMKDRGPKRFNLEKRRKMQKERKQVERFRLLKLLELLNLEEDKENKFIVIFRSYRKKQRQLQKEKTKLIDYLADGLRSRNIEEREIDSLVVEINAINQQVNEHEQLFYLQANDILNPEQRGKLVVFRARFELEVLGRMAQFKRHRMDVSPEKMF